MKPASQQASRPVSKYTSTEVRPFSVLRACMRMGLTQSGSYFQGVKSLNIQAARWEIRPRACGHFSWFQFAKFQIKGLKFQSHCLFSLQNAHLKFKSPRGWAHFSRLSFWKLAARKRTYIMNNTCQSKNNMILAPSRTRHYFELSEKTRKLLHVLVIIHRPVMTSENWPCQPAARPLCIHLSLSLYIYIYIICVCVYVYIYIYI